MRYYIAIVALMIVGVFIFISPVLAEDGGGGPSPDSISGRLETVRGRAGFPGSDKDTGLATIIGKIIAAASSLLGVIFVAQMVYAGWLWMTSRDEADQLEKAKHIIRRSIVGLAIVLGAWAITSFVITNIGTTVA